MWPVSSYISVVLHDFLLTSKCLNRMRPYEDMTYLSSIKVRTLGENLFMLYIETCLSPIISLLDLDPCYFEVISRILSLPRVGTGLVVRIKT